MSTDVPKREKELQQLLEQKGLRMQYKPHLKSWVIWEKLSGRTRAIHGSYHHIIQKAEEFTR